MLVPVVAQAVTSGAKHSSPYVRRTAAFAAPKLVNLDATQREAMEQVVERLLLDRHVLVVGAAAAAFNVLCPDRVELLHQVQTSPIGILELIELAIGQV